MIERLCPNCYSELIENSCSNIYCSYTAPEDSDV